MFFPEYPFDLCSVIIGEVQTISVQSNFNPSLSISLVRVFVLVAWVYYCLYSLQRIEYGTLVPDRFKPIANAFGLLVGPFILFVLFVRDLVIRVQSGEIEYSDIPKIIFKMKLTRPQRKKAEKRFIQLLDSAGKSYFESDDSNETDRETLDALENIIFDAIDNRATDILIDPKTDGYYVVSDKGQDIVNPIKGQDIVNR